MARIKHVLPLPEKPFKEKSEMSERFNELLIDGSVISEIVFIPARSLELSMLRPPGSNEEAQFVTQYRLRFDHLRSCKFGFEAQPWVEVKSHALVADSPYLELYKKSESSAAEFWRFDADIFHFKLVLEEGQIDIIAEQFASTIEKEIPLVGRSDGNT
jgi:hypothetical protein